MAVFPYKANNTKQLQERAEQKKRKKKVRQFLRYLLKIRNNEQGPVNFSESHG